MDTVSIQRYVIRGYITDGLVQEHGYQGSSESDLTKCAAVPFNTSYISRVLRLQDIWFVPSFFLLARDAEANTIRNLR